MKRLFCLLLVSLLLLFSGCGSDTETTQPTESESAAIPLSEQTNFKCHVEYGEEKYELEGETAKELHRLTNTASMEVAYEGMVQDVDSIRLAFYASDRSYPFQQQSENGSTYTVYADGLIAISHYPYISAPFYYKAAPELFDKVLEYLPAE